MKVKCIDRKRLNKNGIYQSLTVGKEYIVLAIEFYDKSESTSSKSIGDFVLYRIRDNEGIVIPFPAKLFELVSHKLPSIWILYLENDGSYSILPEAWARQGFWEDFYDDEENAIEDFKKAEREIIEQVMNTLEQLIIICEDFKSKKYDIIEFQSRLGTLMISDEYKLLLEKPIYEADNELERIKYTEFESDFYKYGTEVADKLINLDKDLI